MFDLSSVYERCSKTIDNTSTDFVQKYRSIISNKTIVVLFNKVVIS
jgi:hypothetical protein